MPDKKPTPDIGLIKLALAGQCPRCQEGKIFKPGFFTTAVKDECPVCGLRLAENDSADAPAVFLIFVLGFSLVPLALLLEKLVAPPIYVHVILWGIIAIGISLWALKPLKAYVIALQWKYHPWTDRADIADSDKVDRAGTDKADR